MCVCMRVHVCVYILAMGLDPSELRQCFASCWAWEKDGTPFHSCLAEAWAAGGPLYPPSHTHTHTHPGSPLFKIPPNTHTHTNPSPPSIPFRLQPTGFQKQDPLPSPS